MRTALTTTCSRRAFALAAVVATVAFAALGGAQTAQAAGPGTFEFTSSKGECHQTLDSALIIVAPAINVYGLTTSSDWVHVWYRLVDLAGNGQTQWIEKPWATASSTAPARFGTTQITRGIWNTYSRMQFFVQYYSNGQYTQYAQSTLQLYDTYGFGGPLLNKTYNGVKTACYR
jgi:hypothetical protein